MDIIKKKSFDVSLILLATISLLTALRSTNQISDKDKIKLQLSTFVTTIASCHYFLMRNALHNQLIIYRYLDWFFTTPILLIELIIILDVYDYNLIKEIIFLNFLMLLFGFLGELNLINKFFCGIIAFIIFYKLYNKINLLLNKSTSKYKYIVKPFIIFWTLYGIIYFLTYFNINDDYQTISFNILDIITKGFFGLFIYYTTIDFIKN